jgi:hypothetical protein
MQMEIMCLGDFPADAIEVLLAFAPTWDMICGLLFHIAPHADPRPISAG